MWYLIKTIFFAYATFTALFLTSQEILPYELGVILAVGMFGLFGLSVAQIFTNDIF